MRWPPSVEEVPFAGEHHREAELVGLLDHLLRRASRHPVGSPPRHPAAAAASMPSSNGIERVARGRAAVRAARRLLGRDLARLDAVLLPGADADRLAVLDQHDRVRLHVPADRATRARGRATAPGSGATLVTTRQSLRVAAKWCGVLHEEPARDLPEVERLGAGRRALRGCACSCASSAAPRSCRARSPARSRRRPAGRRPSRSTVARVDRPVQRDDPAERGTLVALERALVRGRRASSSTRDAARVRVLDDGARGPDRRDRARAATRRRRRSS